MFHDLKLLGTDSGLDFHVRLEPGKQLYCLYGENGAGKTSFLCNLARTLLAWHSVFGPQDESYRWSKVEQLVDLQIELLGQPTAIRALIAYWHELLTLGPAPGGSAGSG